MIQIGPHTLHHGDCLEVMATMEAESIDAIVTDPPYGLAFMGKSWDHGVPGEPFWRQALRVAKPGTHLLAFGGTRTYHRLACVIEDAGWEIRDCIMWVYGCLSDDTEVLTPDGWERYHIARSKEILAYDPKADVYQWERPERWSEYRVEQDTAYRVESDTTDQIVSRNHRCLVERGGVLAFVAAEECAGLERVPTLSGDLRWVPEAEAAVLQSAVQRTLSGSGLGEARTQGACGVDRGERCQLHEEDVRPKQPCVEGRLDVLQEEGEVRKPVDQIRSMPRGVCCDGSEGRIRHGASAVGGYGVGATAFAERVRASLQPRCDGQQAGEPGAVCIERGPQAIRARTSYQTTLATFTPIEYSGLIFCPTVSTGAFVARRNGKVFITGNSGFPKSLDVSKAIDAAAGAEREVIGKKAAGWHVSNQINDDGWKGENDGVRVVSLTAPATDAAKKWDGWGTALKPAWEPIIVARKPLAGTVAANVLAYGTGALNIDGCRVPHDGESLGGGRISTKADGWDRPWKHDDSAVAACRERGDAAVARAEELGRFPANLIHDGSDDVTRLFPNEDGISASRFFYAAKASKADRDDGCDGMERRRATFAEGTGLRNNGDGTPRNQTPSNRNHHPTVKPTDLMRYLCRLVTPPDGRVLDPFTGSGSTGKAASLEGFRFTGIELDKSYIDIATARIRAAHEQFNGGPLFADK
jgi:DNA modification methylase